MLINEIELDLADVMHDPELQIEPEGLSPTERERWQNWQLSGGKKYVPSPGQIDAAARLIRAAGLQAEFDYGPRQYQAMEPRPVGNRFLRW